MKIERPVLTSTYTDNKSIHSLLILGKDITGSVFFVFRRRFGLFAGILVLLNVSV